MNERRTQASRRADTQAAVLASATKLFGTKGFANTSLEDIAKDCDISIAPIYHYFGNKKKLFLAVNEAMEGRIVTDSELASDGGRLQAGWRAFSNLCQDPIFRKIVLVDSPNVLGRERMHQSKVAEWALERMRKRFNAEGADNYKAELLGRMMMGALSEAGLFIGQAENSEQASLEAVELVNALIASFKV